MKDEKCPFLNIKISQGAFTPKVEIRSHMRGIVFEEKRKLRFYAACPKTFLAYYIYLYAYSCEYLSTYSIYLYIFGLQMVCVSRSERFTRLELEECPQLFLCVSPWFIHYTFRSSNRN